MFFEMSEDPLLSLHPVLVHECHGACWLATTDPREELQSQAHMDGHKHIGGIYHHGDGREEDGVKDGLFPRLQDIDAGDEQVLIVKPGQVLLQVLQVHPVKTDGVKESWQYR